MAVFEKKVPRKVCLDDTQALTCFFENAQNIQGHTEYVIRVQRGPLSEKTWHINKRYNDFVTLQNALQVSGLNLPLPPKKLIGNMDREFVAERQSGLQNYMNFILMNPILASSLPVRKFLDPDNYGSKLQESALQHVSMALRSEINYEVIRPVPEMGWRVRKHYILVKSRSSPKEELLLSWVEHGPDKYLEDRDLQGVFKSIAALQHPSIQPMDFLSCSETGGFVIYSLNNAGSLRDMLCSSKPKLQFMKKYGNPKQVKTLPASDIAYYGRQILEALSFLLERGLPYGHLHTGNIVLENGRAKLLDIVNGVLGLPSYYRPYFVQHKKIQTLEAIDVYCFGHVLYEMAFGHPLHESVCDIFPSNCPPLLKSVLESILSSEACKGGLPTISALLMHPFFNYSPPPNQLSSSTLCDRPHLKFSVHLKEVLKMTWQKTETRLREEQKMVRQQKRLAKVQELLSSDEEKKRRKQKLKQEQKQQQQQHQQKLQQQQQQFLSNGKSPERSESPNSTSTATSAGTLTPPSGLAEYSAPPPPPMPAPGLQPSGQIPVDQPPERTALFDAICSFNKTKLRHSTVKESLPPVGRVC